MENVITYKIQEDIDGKLKVSAKEACNFWNEFITPNTPIVVRIGYYYSIRSSVAKAWASWVKGETTYGRVEFNRRKLIRFSKRQITSSLIHEIGHVLGFGFGNWNELYDKRTGKFHQSVIDKLPGLAAMKVELGYGRGTCYSHWDERLFDGEVMTGFKDRVEYVLPITIDVMSALGHRLKKQLDEKMFLDQLIDNIGQKTFTRQTDVADLDVDYLEITEIEEEITEDVPPSVIDLDAPLRDLSASIEPQETLTVFEIPASFETQDNHSTQGSLAIIIGHTKLRPGARAIPPLSFYEYEYNTEIASLAKEYATHQGLEVEIFTRDQAGITGAYQNAADWEPDAICELHFNAANGQAKGTEILYSDERDRHGIYEKELAQEMQKRLCQLFERQGREDRGIKNRTGRRGERGFTNLGQNFNIPIILIEPFFGDNPQDAMLGLQLKTTYAQTIVNGFIQWKKDCDKRYADS